MNKERKDGREKKKEKKKKKELFPFALLFVMASKYMTFPKTLSLAPPSQVLGNTQNDPNPKRNLYFCSKGPFIDLCWVLSFIHSHRCSLSAYYVPAPGGIMENKLDLDHTLRKLKVS